MSSDYISLTSNTANNIQSQSKLKNDDINMPFPSSKNSHFQNETCIRTRNHFHINN